MTALLKNISTGIDKHSTKINLSVFSAFVIIFWILYFFIPFYFLKIDLTYRSYDFGIFFTGFGYLFIFLKWLIKNDTAKIIIGIVLDIVIFSVLFLDIALIYKSLGYSYFWPF